MNEKGHSLVSPFLFFSKQIYFAKVPSSGSPVLEKQLTFTEKLTPFCLSSLVRSFPLHKHRYHV